MAAANAHIRRDKANIWFLRLHGPAWKKMFVERRPRIGEQRLCPERRLSWLYLAEHACAHHTSGHVSRISQCSGLPIVSSFESEPRAKISETAKEMDRQNKIGTSAKAIWFRIPGTRDEGQTRRS